MSESMGETMNIKAYKGFNANWTCRGFKYEIGKTYEHTGKVSLCHSGFHACEYPLDIFEYYEPAGQLAEVELGGVTDEKDGDSKRVGKSITIKASLTIPLLVSAAVEFITNKCEPAKAQHATGSSSASSATGDRSASSATGSRSASSATGYSSASSATGSSSASLTTGNYSSAEVLKADSHSIAVGAGYKNKARAAAGCALVLVHRNDDYEIVHIRASKVGENGIKPDTWYSLNAAGEFVEVK